MNNRFAESPAQTTSAASAITATATTATATTATGPTATDCASNAVESPDQGAEHVPPAETPSSTQAV